MIRLLSLIPYTIMTNDRWVRLMRKSRVIADVHSDVSLQLLEAVVQDPNVLLHLREKYPPFDTGNQELGQGFWLYAVA